MGRGVELASDGALIFRALIDVSYPGLSGSDFFWQSGEHEAPVGTIEAGHMLKAAVAGLGQQLEQAIPVFVENVPES